MGPVFVLANRRCSPLRPIPERFCLRIEALLPFLMIVETFAHERGEDGEIHQKPVDETGRKFERLHEIDEQHHPGLVGMIPRLMLIGIIENEDLALAPVGSDPSPLWRSCRGAPAR